VYAAPAPAPPAYTPAYTQPQQYSGPPAYAEDDDASGPPPAPEEFSRDFAEEAAATINANSASIAGMFA
jgi:hypothetical protein